MEISDIILEFYKANEDASAVKNMKPITSLDELQVGMELFLHNGLDFRAVRIDDLTRISDQVTITKGFFSRGYYDFANKDTKDPLTFTSCYPFSAETPSIIGKDKVEITQVQIEKGNLYKLLLVASKAKKKKE